MEQMRSAIIENIKARENFNIELEKLKKPKKWLRKLRKWEVKAFIKNLPKSIARFVDYRIKRLRYSDSDIKLARIFKIPISLAWALGQDDGNLYRKMKKGRQ